MLRRVQGQSSERPHLERVVTKHELAAAASHASFLETVVAPAALCSSSMYSMSSTSLWGKRVGGRDGGRERKENPEWGQLTSFKNKVPLAASSCKASRVKTEHVQ